MIINHNLAALNTIRQLGINSNNTQKALEKLSSGLRINSAADDAAGLAISEKMRGQISGLEMAQKNAQDGISLISTAEGALNETHSILQRMRELAVQSSNDSNTGSDREQLQKEVNQLSQEITRIGNDTEFNTQNLLNGNFSGTFQIGANQDQNLSISIGDMRSYTLGVTGDATTKATGAYTAGSTNSITDGNYTVKDDGSGAYNLVDQNGTTVATSSDGLTFKGKADATETLVFDQAVKSGTVTVDTSGDSVGTASFTNDGLQSGTYKFDSANNALVDANGNTVATTADSGKTFTNIQGDTVVTFSAALADGASVEVGGTNISTQDAANKAITTIQNAIDKVSTQRSALGAYQNRLEHTINNLGTSSQNLTAAESRIRDVDMAKEMAEFTKNNILNQAAQAMLAQANNLPQGVLQLLR